MLAIDFFLFILSFVLIWFAARLIVATVADLAHLTHLSSFGLSFFLMAFCTSLPEFFISTNAIINHAPEIFAGTLLGATIVIFLFVIPLLSILGGGIMTRHELSTKSLIILLMVIFLPFVFGLDGEFSRFEGVMMIAAYGGIFFMVERKQNFVQKIETSFKTKRRAEFLDLAKIVCAGAVLFLAGQILVGKTVALSEFFHISPFLISLLILAIGTDIPETSVAIVTALKKSASLSGGTRPVAMGDYLGSAAVNTLLFGILVLIYGSFKFQDATFSGTSVLFLLGLVLFFVFGKSKNNLSRSEGFALLLLYALFLGVTIWKG